MDERDSSTPNEETADTAHTGIFCTCDQVLSLIFGDEAASMAGCPQAVQI